MKETVFIERNRKSWEELELLLKSSYKDADRLQTLFIKVSSDLSYASTHYPNRAVRAYLNQLVQQVFDSMKKKKVHWTLEPIATFFNETLPHEMYRSRKVLLLSFMIFTFSVLIGIFSTLQDMDFLRAILGNEYVDMTEQNIQNEDPMAVYKGMEQSGMFFMITINNIRVAFMTFLTGILTGIVTSIFLMFNGIMLGAFQSFFYVKGLFWESFLTIWIHGTIEISAIIIAGCAGIILGNGILFPGSYTRNASLLIAIRRALTIVLGTVPLFIIAGFLESFVTRYTEMPVVLKIFIILSSLAFIIWMYVIYPRRKSIGTIFLDDIKVFKQEDFDVDENKYVIRKFGENLSLTIKQIRTNFLGFFRSGILPSTLLIVLLFFLRTNEMRDYWFEDIPSSLLSMSSSTIYTKIGIWLALGMVMYAFSKVFLLDKVDEISSKFLLKKIPFFLFLSAIPVFSYFLIHPVVFWILLIFIPPGLYALLSEMIINNKRLYYTEIADLFKKVYRHWGILVVSILLFVVVHFLIISMLNSGIFTLVEDFLNWHDLFDSPLLNSLFISSVIEWIVLVVFYPLYMLLSINVFYSSYTKEHAIDLKQGLELFGHQKSIFE